MVLATWGIGIDLIMDKVEVLELSFLVDLQNVTPFTLLSTTHVTEGRSTHDTQVNFHSQ